MGQKEQAGNTHLGVPSMEALHRRLFVEIEHTTSASDAAFPAQYASLLASIESEFYAEENAMDRIDYPGLKAHREQHARLLGGLHHAASRVVGGDLEAGREALLLLPQWFSLHITTSDAALAVAMEIAGLPEGAYGGER